MATTKGSSLQLDLNKSGEVSLAAAADISFPLSGPGDHAVLILDNSSGSAAATFTLHGGDMFCGREDLVVSVPTGKIHVLSVDSGNYKQTKGDLRGQLHLTASGGTPKAALVALPQYHLT